MSKSKPPPTPPIALHDTTKTVAGPIDTPSLSRVHDAAQQTRLLRTALQDDKQRIGYFLGAGCPLGIYDDRGEKSLNLIPAVIPLTERIGKGLIELDKLKGAGSKFKATWDCLHQECKGTSANSPTVEDILTELRTLSNRRGSAAVAGLAKTEMVAIDTEICSLILEAMKQSLPSHRCSYHRFASWIGGVQRQSPVEVFTPNYDLLFEQAFEQHPLPHFDGFVGSREPYFDLASIEHDTIPPRWTRLWKLHGSINWERLEEKINGQTVTRVVRVTREAEAGKVLIYPSHLKYDQSRRMPYLAMLDRLRAFFRTEPSRKDVSPPLLIVCGYSFLDEHLNEVLLDGLRGNRKAHCVALMFESLGKIASAVYCAERLHNLTVLARDGAVVGNRKGLYCDGSIGGDEHKPWLYEVTEGGDPANPIQQTRSHLGDFHFFGLFLEQLSGQRSGVDHAALHH